MTSEAHLAAAPGAASASLQLPRPLAIALMAEAQRAPEAEICGLIAERPDGSLRLRPIANVAAEPGSRFEMDAAGLLAAQKAMRADGERLWAIYHSHPHTAAVPSALDITLGGHPELPQLIVSLDVRGVLQLRAWRVGADDVEELPLRVA